MPTLHKFNVGPLKIKEGHLTADIDYTGGQYHINVFWGVTPVATVTKTTLQSAVYVITKILQEKYLAILGPVKQLTQAREMIAKANRNLYAVDESGRKFFGTLFPNDSYWALSDRNNNLTSFVYALHDIQKKLWQVV